MAKGLNQVSDFIDKLSRTVMSICFAIAFIATFYQVISRYILNNPQVLQMFPNANTFNFPWLEEFIRYLFVWGVFLGITVVYKAKGHAFVEIILQVLPPKIKRWFEVISEALNCVLFAILLVKAFEMSQIASNQISPLLGIPMSVMYMSIVISSFFCIIHALAFFVKSHNNFERK